jgi:hypothetical protein
MAIRISPPRRPFGIFPVAQIGRLPSMDRKLRSEDAEAANFGFFCEEAPGTGPCAQVLAAARPGCGRRRTTAADNARLRGHEVPMRFIALTILRRN